MNGTLVQGFLYESQPQPAALLDGANQVVARFVYGIHANVPEYMIKRGVTYRLVTDHLGSVRLVVDVSSGAVAQRIDYDEFGRVTANTNPGFQPFEFAGGLVDDATTLVHFGARDYDPETARWLTKDPLGFGGGGTNVSQYALNDPINVVDPTGLRPLTPCEKAVLAPYIPQRDLDHAEIFPDATRMSLFPSNTYGYTVGDNIYFRAGDFDPSTVDGISVLGHELVHVGQYARGDLSIATYLWEAYRHGYRNNKYEAPAYEMQNKIRNDLNSHGGDRCACKR